MGSNGPPHTFSQGYPGSDNQPPQNNNSQSFSPAVIAVVGILGAAFLLVSYYTMVAKFCILHRARRRNRAVVDDDNEAVWPIFTQGLQASVIQSIPVCKYSKSDGLVDGSECAVCLSEFEEEEPLRLLPKCSHAFHLPCIDKWLQSHSNCPLCRANIMSPIPFPVPVSRASLPAIATADEGNAAQSLQEAGNSVQDSSEPRSLDDYRSSHGSLRFEGGSNLQAEGELEGVDTKKHVVTAEKRIPSSLGGLRCSSAGHVLNMGEKERIQCQGGGDNNASTTVMMRRSCSVGSFKMGLEHHYIQNKQGVMLEDLQLNMLYGNNKDGELQKKQQALDYTDTSSLLVDMETPGTSSNIVASRDFKSRSLNHDITFKSNKSELMGADPLMGRMLLSLKGPRAVKRTFSGGRLFGFRLKSTENTRLPI